MFTANATGALKLVGEAYPFAAGGRCLLTFDNHNSVNGIREFARARGACVEYAPLTVPDLRIDRERLDALLDQADPHGANLFAFPAQSNFSGVQHPLDLIERAHAQRLGCAARCRRVRADEPAGPLARSSPTSSPSRSTRCSAIRPASGVCIVRETVLPKLKRPWFAGGTVNFATVQGRAHILAPREAGFEDGTLNYLSVPAVEIGLRHLERIGLETIRTRVACLTAGC